MANTILPGSITSGTLNRVPDSRFEDTIVVKSAADMGTFAFSTINKNDRIEFLVENESAARNVTLLLSSFTAVQER